MSRSMRILSYNTQMRSALMEMGFPPSIPPVYTAPQRAVLIAKAILDSPQEIDVVCLNEVFDEPSREILSTLLRSEFPHQVTKADTFHTSVVTTGIADDILEKVWELTFGPFEDVAGLALGKAEDSGLFLASRFPFATVPPPSEVTDLVGPLFDAVGGVPVTRFQMYADSSGNDRFAAKGVLYACVKPDRETERHLFLSHTQADDKRPEENAGDRRKQMTTVASFMEYCLGESAPFSKEVFFLGDLNIVGSGKDDGLGGEWEQLFVDAAGPLSEHLVDRWGRDQCPGGTTGRTDPGTTADVAYPPARQRLDYLVTSATSDLTVQHLRVADDLADPHGQLPYKSDHYPLLADINVRGDHSTPATALRAPAVVDFHDDGFLDDGRVTWYRFDRAGTYDIALRTSGPLAMETYLGDDFSHPQAPYREITDPERGTRFVLAAPFFVKVFPTNRFEKASFDLDVHRHEGRGLEDAIVLVPGSPRNERFPRQQFNVDSAVADWDDSESKWFIVETPRVPVPRIDLAVEVSGQNEHSSGGSVPTAVTLTLGTWDGVHLPVSELTHEGASSAPLEVPWRAGQDEHFVITVQRGVGAGTVVDFDIEVRTTLSLLLARPATKTTLVCREETSGWGADDIALRVQADDEPAVVIPNSVIGDFEQDSVRTVGDKLPALMPYVDRVTVTVIEEDDIDDNDVGTGHVPLAKDATGSPDFTVLHRGLDGRIEGSIEIAVDDGRYGFACVIASWHPSM